MEKAMRGTLRVLFLASVAWSANSVAVEPVGLQLALQTNKQTYAPYEVVVVKYSLENQSQTAVSVPRSIDPKYGWFGFEIASENGGFKPYRTGELADGGWQDVSLEPGKRLCSEAAIMTDLFGRAARMNRQYAGTKLFPFSNAGRYRIRATYLLADPDSRGDGRRITSNTVEFRVRPASDDEAAAFAIFTTPEDYAAAVGADADTKDLQAAIQRWEGFTERFPTSIYTPAVRMHLGQVYLNGIGLEQPDPAMAAVHFRAVADANSVGWADDALIELAKAEIERGRVDEAQAALVKFLERFPDSGRKAEATRLREGLAKGRRTLQEIYSK